MRYQKQKGFSLIELMVGLTLGGLLSFTLVNIAMMNKRSFLLNQDNAVLQDNARFAGYTFNRIASIAGYRSLPDTANLQPFSSSAEVFTNPYIEGTTGDGDNDTLTIRYQGSGDGAGNDDGTIRDCDNNGIDSGEMSTNTFSVNEDNELVCNNTVLISNVDRFKVLYGEDLDGDRNADRYVRSDHPALDLSQVVSVRISLLLSTENDITDYENSDTYTVLGEEYDPPDDRKIRRSFTYTLQLKNFDQTAV